MPEGPSIVLLRQEAARFKGKTVRHASGSTSVDLTPLVGRRVKAVRSWGKHFLLEFSRISLRIHLMMFGSYRIDARKEAIPRVCLQFDKGELNLYACSVKLIEQALDDVYDWRADVMSDTWDARLARRKLKAMPDVLVCDALLDQNVFAGVGNIIKNEVLFRTGIHPASRVGDLPPRVLTSLISQAREYSFDFLRWKLAFELKKHWKVHAKRTCPSCRGPISKQHMGTTHRRTFFCPTCQACYGQDASLGVPSAGTPAGSRRKSRKSHMKTPR
ncbi:endonuclease [Stenotrophomonas maltophilia]|uniref:DNA-formamidopyrimidine glycosylase family protein n=1 Tax=Stenotrophomonas maltophilia TaxID=40324 RepID=UPI001075E2DD|nr:DNA-formamidopyrimidine glycosylase family protein [Stenotrophomonas maltophilia]TFZ44646.1 endonuclease [Stenotrophomonas maltophilia]